jgi:hypothetical protein
MFRCERREPVLAGIVKFTKRILPIFRREEVAACASGSHPRSPSASFSNDNASAFSFVVESARSSTGVAVDKSKNLLNRWPSSIKTTQSVVPIAC